MGILCGTCEGSNAVVDNTATELLLLPILDNFIRLQEERVQVRVLSSSKGSMFLL